MLEARGEGKAGPFGDGGPDIVYGLAFDFGIGAKDVRFGLGVEAEAHGPAASDTEGIVADLVFKGVELLLGGIALIRLRFDFLCVGLVDTLKLRRGIPDGLFGPVAFDLV